MRAGPITGSMDRTCELTTSDAATMMSTIFPRGEQHAKQRGRQSWEDWGNFGGSAGLTTIPHIIAAYERRSSRRRLSRLHVGRGASRHQPWRSQCTPDAQGVRPAHPADRTRAARRVEEELHRCLWADTFVTDATIAGVVKELRRVLGKGDRGESLIRTTHGFGYAFTGMIHACEEDAQADGRHWLVSGTRRLSLGTGSNDIGRDPRAAVWLDSPQASRLHARITIAGDVATLEDLGSKNRTLVNNQPVTQPTLLNDGDAIHIGAAVFVFRVTNLTASTETAANRAPG